MVKAIIHKDGVQIGQNHNDLERVVLPEYPQVFNCGRRFRTLAS